MDLWQTAVEQRATLTWSTLIGASSFRKGFGTAEDAAALVRWCREYGVTKVYVESFRGGYFAEDEPIRRVADALREAGIEAAGGVTTNGMKRRSTGWEIIGCYSDEATCEQLQQAFEQAARLFDLVMIDDFFFTDCECERCTAAKGEQTWPQFRMDLMHRLARDRVIGPARRVNPHVQLILKYPQWYDRLHIRGYDVERLTEAFDVTWAGTELRDPDHTDPMVPNVLQTQGQFVMGWLKAVSGGKCGGGWFDTIATGPDTYLEQAWQTILGGAAEAVLFNYHSFGKPTERACLARYREHVGTLFELARQVRARRPRGVATPKPPSSDPGDGRYVYDHFGMLGLPMRPMPQLTTEAEAAFVPAENLADPRIAETVNALLAAGKPVVATDGLLAGAPGIEAEHPGLLRLDLNGRPASMLELNAATVNRVREHLLTPFGLTLDAPVGVGMVLVGDDLAAISNYRNEPATVRLGGAAVNRSELLLQLPQDRAVTLAVAESGDGVRLELPGRAMGLVRL